MAKNVPIGEVVHQMSQVVVDMSAVAAQMTMLASNFKQMYAAVVVLMKETSRELTL